VDGEVLLTGLEGHALRHRPGRERAVHLEPEVVMQPPCVVALDYEDRPLATSRGNLPVPPDPLPRSALRADRALQARFRRLFAVALPLVVGQLLRGHL